MQHLSVNSARGLIKTLHHGPVDTDRWEVAMDRAWPLVETFSDRIELLLAVDGQVRALGEVLAQETVGVLAGSPLPGAMGVAEVDRDPGLGGQLGMARRLCPSWAITMIVARSSADSCSKCLVITTPINVEVLHLILDYAITKRWDLVGVPSI